MVDMRDGQWINSEFIYNLLVTKFLDALECSHRRVRKKIPSFVIKETREMELFCNEIEKTTKVDKGVGKKNSLLNMCCLKCLLAI